jgi:photosystem II stability/assembly factor-like uncharacterized protein
MRHPGGGPVTGFCRRAAASLAIGILALGLTTVAGRGADSPVQAARSLLLAGTTVEKTVVAVGAYGHILCSPDNGATWEVAAVPTAVTLTGVCFPDARHGWAVGHDALILHSDDGGRTWARQFQGTDLDAPLLSVLFLDARTGFAVGAYSQYLATADGGQTWIPHRIIDQDRHFNRITVGPAGALYIAGEQGTLLRSTDRGVTWQRLASPYDGSFYGILPLTPQALLAYGLRGRIFRSDDNGDHWQLVPVEPRVLLATAVRLRSGTIVLAGQARAFLVSRDGGRSFASWTTTMTTPVAELLETPDGRLLALGETGVTPLPAP